MNAILLTTALLATGQFPIAPPDQVPPPKTGPYKPPGDADSRKEARDLVLKTVGEEARSFTRAYGDLGVQVLTKIKPETGKALVNLHQSGVLERLKDPRAVLQAVRVHGQPAGEWLAANADRLMDRECQEIWCRNTLDVCYDLIDLEQSAAQTRASVRYLPRLVGNAAMEWGVSQIANVVLGILLVIALLWKRKPAASG